MQAGTKKSIRVYFPRENNAGWLGGVNYFKNLFFALSLVNDGSICPYLPPNNPEELFEHVNKFKKSAFYWDKFVCAITGRKYNKMDTIVKKADILSHCYTVYKNTCCICWIPDFQHLHLPDMFEQSELVHRNETFADMAKNANTIILSSYDALNDFKKFAPEHANKARVLNFVSYIDPQVYDVTNNISAQVSATYDLPKKYFYVPNQFWKHKNHICVLNAIALLKKQGVDVNVVFSGSKSDYRDNSFFSEILDIIQKYNIQQNVRLLGVIKLTEVYYLMRHCVSIINPSLFEGSSSTVEEAKSIGKNIILSDLNVHREQNPMNALYFSPHDCEQLAVILKEKWNNSQGGPDFDLEVTARGAMLDRMKSFGENYKKILFEAYNTYNADNKAEV